MASILTIITFIVVGIVVIALVIYLLGIIFALRGANKNLYQLAGGLEQIAEDTQLLSDKLVAINTALGELQNRLLAVNGDLAAIVKLLGR